MPDQPDLAIDVSQVALPNRIGGQDLWLTKTDASSCSTGRTSAGHRAKADAEMPVLVGPVSPGRVSPRTPLPPGRYRVFAQGLEGSTANDYESNRCLGHLVRGSPVSP